MFSYNQLTDLVNELVMKYDLVPVGSFARREPMINDLDFINRHMSNVELYNDIFNHYNVCDLLSYGPSFVHFTIDIPNLNEEININIWKANDKNLLFQIVSRVYDKQMQIILRKKAKQLGYKLNQNGLYKDKNRVSGINTIHDLFDKLQLEYKDYYVG